MHRELFESRFVDDEDEGSELLAVDERRDDQRLVIDHARGRDGDMDLACGRQLRPCLHLNGHVRTIGQPVHHAVDAHVSQREEHMQPTHRLAHQLRPDLELRHLARGQRLALMPLDVHLQFA